jgi:hypothetical protein
MSAAFQPGYLRTMAALSSGLCIPLAFRRLAFASCVFPFPLRDSAFLTVGLLAIGADDAPRPDRIGIAVFRTPEMRLGWVSSMRRSRGVRTTGSTATRGLRGDKSVAASL